MRESKRTSLAPHILSAAKRLLWCLMPAALALVIWFCSELLIYLSQCEITFKGPNECRVLGYNITPLIGLFAFVGILGFPLGLLFFVCVVAVFVATFLWTYLYVSEDEV